MLKIEANINILHVPYRGVSAAIADVIAGQVNTAFSSVPSVLSFIRSGKVHALAVSSAKRIAVASNVPTITKSGFPGFDVNPWWGILAPANTDTAIVKKINTDVNEALRNKDMIAFLAKQGAEPYITTPEEILAVLNSDIDKWARVIKAANIKMN